jgi:hypothetical protein
VRFYDQALRPWVFSLVKFTYPISLFIIAGDEDVN